VSIGRLRRLSRPVVSVLPAWLLSRAVVVATLALATRIVDQLHPADPSAVLRVHQGLLAWDGGWYETIARSGYDHAGRSALRFFPAFPLLGRWIGAVSGIGASAALVIVANLLTLVGMAVLFRLVEWETGDDELASRAVWLLALAPAAYVLVMGYSEGMFLACILVGFSAARRRWWWIAAVAGLATGLVRPLGLLLAIPFAVELARPLPEWWRRRHTSRTSASSAADADAPTGADLAGGRMIPISGLLAVAAPVVGTGAYLAWVGARFGSALLPFREQTQGNHRGPITAPFSAMVHNALAVLHGHHVGSALHIPWVILSLFLLVVVARRLPASYTAFTAAILVVSMASTNLDSFERYALSAFPLVVAGASITSRPEVWRVVLAGVVASMVGYALLAFLGIVVP
jgi:hypothetical protein